MIRITPLDDRTTNAIPPIRARRRKRVPGACAHIQRGAMPAMSKTLAERPARK